MPSEHPRGAKEVSDQELGVDGTAVVNQSTEAHLEKVVTAPEVEQPITALTSPLGGFHKARDPGT